MIPVSCGVMICRVQHPYRSNTLTSVRVSQHTNTKVLWILKMIHLKIEVGTIWKNLPVTERPCQANKHCAWCHLCWCHDGVMWGPPSHHRRCPWLWGQCSSGFGLDHWYADDPVWTRREKAIHEGIQVTWQIKAVRKPSDGNNTSEVEGIQKYMWDWPCHFELWIPIVIWV